MGPLITQTDRGTKCSGDVLCRPHGDLGMKARLTGIANGLQLEKRP
jgi:hypothetical protein